MSKLSALKKEILNTRSIKVETYLVDDDKVIVEGRLEDTRHVPIYTSSDNLLDPGPVHGMTVRFLIGEMPPRILETEVQMDQVPMDECPEAAKSVSSLVGLTISYGYSKTVKSKLGGVKGCVHMTSLILAMAGAALQGWANSQRRQAVPSPARGYITEYIKNSCLAWREDGPLYKETIAREKRD